MKTRGGGGIDTKSNGYCNLSMSRSQYLFAIKKLKRVSLMDALITWHCIIPCINWYTWARLCKAYLGQSYISRKKAHHGICSYSRILASLPLISGLDITLYFPIHTSIRIFKKNFCIVILKSTKILFLIGLVSLRSVTWFYSCFVNYLPPSPFQNIFLTKP